MRGKRSKQYRKLMQQYALTFQFREPYQVLVDAQMIQDTHRFSMDLIPALSRTLHGQVKPMITQCSIRHLFALPTSDTTASSDQDSSVIAKATKSALLDISRSLTLRRCNHHTLPEPLSTLDCYHSVMDPKDQATNKHRYILAVQDESVRSWARGVKGVPMIYVKRSVMVMEPMAHASLGVREKEERGKLRAGAKTRPGGTDIGTKRKRGDAEEGNGDTTQPREQQKKRKKTFGIKEPNPLSVKKKKKPTPSDGAGDRPSNDPKPGKEPAPASLASEEHPKKKRRRKHTSGLPDFGFENESMPSRALAEVEAG